MAEIIKSELEKSNLDKVIRLVRYDKLTEFVDSVDGVHYSHNVYRVLLSIFVNGLLWINLYWFSEWQVIPGVLYQLPYC